MDPFPLIIPPLGEGTWLGFVEDLFQNDQSIMPEVEVLDVSIFSSKTAAIESFCIDILSRREFSEPLFRLFVCLGKQKGEGAHRLFHKPNGKQRTTSISVYAFRVCAEF
jgi:hypothetical protein